MARKYKLTNHAASRLQQRAIPKQMIPIIESYGDRRWCGDGAESLQIPKRQLKKLRQDLRHVLNHLDSLSNSYVVVKGDLILTAAHSY